MTDMQGMQGRIAEAQAASAAARERLAIVDSKLTRALSEQRYADAEAFKADLPAAQHDFALAEATLRALSVVHAEIRGKEAERHRAEQLAVRRQAARKVQAEAMAAEESALDAMQRHLADVEPGLAAVRESLRAAVQAERAAGIARVHAYQAAVELGERPANVYVAAPNAATVLIDTSPVLTAISRGSAT